MPKNRKISLDLGRKEREWAALDVDSASFSASLVQSNRGGLCCKSSGHLADADDDLGRPIWDLNLFGADISAAESPDRWVCPLRTHR